MRIRERQKESEWVNGCVSERDSARVSENEQYSHVWMFWILMWWDSHNTIRHTNTYTSSWIERNVHMHTWIERKIRKTPQYARIYFREWTSDVLLYWKNIANESKNQIKKKNNTRNSIAFARQNNSQKKKRKTKIQKRNKCN